MGNSQSRPVVRSRSVCVIEVVREEALRPKWWECVISIPGHPGAFSKTFSTPVGILSDDEMKDLSNWLLMTVQNVIYASCGVQTMFAGTSHREPPESPQEATQGA